MGLDLIGIDLDGILTKEHEFERRFYRFTRKKGYRSHEKDFIGCEDYAQLLEVDNERAKSIVREFYMTRQFRRMAPSKKAQQAVGMLKSKGFTPVLITARPKEISELTEAWAHKHYGISEVYFSNTWFGSDEGSKADICSRYGISLMIEDSVREAELLAEKGIQTLLLNWREPHIVSNKIFTLSNWKYLIEADYCQGILLGVETLKQGEGSVIYLASDKEGKASRKEVPFTGLEDMAGQPIGFRQINTIRHMTAHNSYSLELADGKIMTAREKYKDYFGGILAAEK